jgi:hypothetical protein
MFGVVKVFGGMLVLGRVATGGVSANQAHTQMDPGIASLNAVFAHMLVRLPYFDLIKVSAFFRHRFLPVLKCNSFCDEQVLRKRPLLVNPLCFTLETGVACHLENLVG